MSIVKQAKSIVSRLFSGTQPIVTLAEEPLSRPSKHFDWDDVACNDRYNSMPPPELMPNVIKAAALMEEIRSFLGDRPILVNSWYRTKAYNDAVKGGKESQHMLGTAVDFRVVGMSPQEVFTRLWHARRTNALAIGGLGGYVKFVHVDIRGEKKSWKTGAPWNDMLLGKK